MFKSKMSCCFASYFGILVVLTYVVVFFHNTNVKINLLSFNTIIIVLVLHDTPYLSITNATIHTIDLMLKEDT